MKPPFATVLWTILTMQFVKNEAAFSVIRWNKRVGEFEQIPGFPTYKIEAENRVLSSRKRETHNYNRQPLHLTYYHDLGFVNFIENDTKVSGIYGDLWNTLSEMLNFTLVVKRSETRSFGETFFNGSYSGILEDVRRNRTDLIPKLAIQPQWADAITFTPSFWINHYTSFTYGQWQRDRSWVFKQFSGDLWCLTLIFIVIFSVASFAMQSMLKCYKNPMPPTTFFDHAFDTFATICNQGKVLDYTSSGFHVLAVTVSTFSWLLMVGYGARLMYSMAHEVFAAPYTDLNSLFEKTNIRIVVMNGSLSHSSIANPEPNTIYDRIRRAKRFTVVSSLAEINDKVCLNPKEFVLLDGVHEAKSIKANNRQSCDLLPAYSRTYGVHIASGISRSVENKRSIDIAIIKLREFGLTKAIKERYFPLIGKPSIVRQTDSLVIDLYQFSLIPSVLIAGIVASIVICIAENMYYFARKKPKGEKCLSLMVRPAPVRNCRSAETTAKNAMRQCPVDFR